MPTLQDTVTYLYYSGKTSKTCAPSLSSSFSYFSLIFLNFRFKFYGSLNQMYGYNLVSLIFQLFRLLVTSFKLSCFSYDTSYLSINAFHASCAFSSRFLTIKKGVSVKLMIGKYQALSFPLYIFIFSSSFSASSYVGISTSFFGYLGIILRLEISLVFYFHYSNLSFSTLKLMYLMSPSISALSPFGLDFVFLSLGCNELFN